MSYEANKRWRLKHPDRRNAQKKRNYDSAGYSSRLPWTQEEDRQVLEHSITDRELAAKLNRSIRAVHARRNRLKEVE